MFGVEKKREERLRIKGFGIRVRFKGGERKRTKVCALGGVREAMAPTIMDYSMG